jgi:hypothetical protein
VCSSDLETLYKDVQHTLIKNEKQKTRQKNNTFTSLDIVALEKEDETIAELKTTEENNSLEDPKNLQNLDTVVNYIAFAPIESTLTASDIFQDPIVYKGVGIRLELCKEENEISLKITEIFGNSNFEMEDLYKKITHIQKENSLVSVKDIFEQSNNIEKQFYDEIAKIFRDPTQSKLQLQIKGEENQREIDKKIFDPREKKEVESILDFSNTANKIKNTAREAGERLSGEQQNRKFAT